MIEVIIKDYLDSYLDVPSFFEWDNDMPDEFVLIEKTGSGKENHIKSATLAFQSYSTSLYNAALLNEKIKEAVEGVIVLNEISKVSLNSDYNFTDTDYKRYRYQAVFDFIYY